MFIRIIILLGLICLGSLFGCRGLRQETIQESDPVKSDNRAELLGRWATIVAEKGFGSMVLVVQFNKNGHYSLVSVGPFESFPQGGESLGLNGEVQEGQYQIQNGLLHLDRTDGVSEQCTITMEKGVLILAFNEHRIWTLGRLEPITSARGKRQ
jgi:hypothetical protein